MWFKEKSKCNLDSLSLTLKIPWFNCEGRLINCTVSSLEKKNSFSYKNIFERFTIFDRTPNSWWRIWCRFSRFLTSVLIELIIIPPKINKQSLLTTTRPKRQINCTMMCLPDSVTCVTIVLWRTATTHQKHEEEERKEKRLTKMFARVIFLPGAARAARKVSISTASTIPLLIKLLP